MIMIIAQFAEYSQPLSAFTVLFRTTRIIILSLLTTAPLLKPFTFTLQLHLPGGHLLMTLQEEASLHEYPNVLEELRMKNKPIKPKSTYKFSRLINPFISLENYQFREFAKRSKYFPFAIVLFVPTTSNLEYVLILKKV